MKTLYYKDLCIRNATKEDCEQLAKWWNDGNVMAHAGFPNGLGTTPQIVASEIAKDDDTRKRRLIIEYQHQLIGEMSFHVENTIYEIGIKICETEYQSKGLGRLLLSLYIEELFSMGASKIILDTNLKNLRAQHVYELLGFKKIRVNYDIWKDQLGNPQSSVDYELVKNNFHNYTK